MDIWSPLSWEWQMRRRWPDQPWLWLCLWPAFVTLMQQKTSCMMKESHESVDSSFKKHDRTYQIRPQKFTPWSLKSDARQFTYFAIIIAPASSVELSPSINSLNLDLSLAAYRPFPLYQVQEAYNNFDSLDHPCWCRPHPVCPWVALALGQGGYFIKLFWPFFRASFLCLFGSTALNRSFVYIHRWTGGASDIVKAASTGEDPRATGGLVSFLITLTLGLIKQSNTHTHKDCAMEMKQWM